ncbi:MAG: rhodanese-like domain-containing protein [Chloroflexota bacterium]
MKRLFLFMMMIGLVVLTACSGGNSVTLITPDEYVAQFQETGAEHLLIDVRTPQEFASGHIAGAINIPVDQIVNRLDEIPQNIAVVVYCQSGNRSGRAASILSDNNYNDIYDLGGITRWRNAGYPVQ